MIARDTDEQLSQPVPSRLKSKLMSRFDEAFASDLLKVACDLIGIRSPTGEEEELADYLDQRFQDLGLDVSKQEVEDGRSNVVARWNPNASGTGVLLNGHMDTSTTGTESSHLPIGLRPYATVRDGWIHGLGASNMKLGFVVYEAALRALMDSDISLGGPVTVSAVVGEIEKAQVGSFSGKLYRGGGCGTSFATRHGVLADLALIAEPTALRIQNKMATFIWLRLQTRGRSQHVWSKEAGIDAIPLAISLRDWLTTWEASFRTMYEVDDEVEGGITVGAIQGGYPFKPSIAPADFCDLYIDVRVSPSVKPMDVLHTIRDAVAEWRAQMVSDGQDPGDVYIDPYLCRPGFVVSDDSILCRSIKRAHAQVTGSDPLPAPHKRSHVSCDASILANYGIEAVAYGPGGITRGGALQMYDEEGEVCSFENVITCAKAYALTIMQHCRID